MIIETDNIPAKMSASLVRAVCFLAMNPHVTVTRLSDYLGLSQAATSDMMIGAESSGLVAYVADPADRRKAQLKLTFAGRDLVGNLQPEGAAV